MASLQNKINSFALKSINRVQNPLYEILFNKRRLYLYCFSDRLLFHTLRNNLGDDLNIDFIETISGRKIIKEEYSKLAHSECFSFIGSILEYVCSKNRPVTVWGTGFKFDHNSLLDEDIRKNKYLAVRGPLTRDIILKAGGICPPVYGDPGILLSRFYKYERKKTYKFGVIPHKTELNLETVQSLKKRDDILLLDIVNYGSCDEFLSRMNMCEYIVSSSLHGIIMADSYEIPNVWTKFSPSSDGGGFKFHDYFLGAQKDAKCIDLSYSFDEPIIMAELAEWQPPTVDETFVEACPFSIIKKKKY